MDFSGPWKGSSVRQHRRRSCLAHFQNPVREVLEHLISDSSTRKGVLTNSCGMKVPPCLEVPVCCHSAARLMVMAPSRVDPSGVTCI